MSLIDTAREMHTRMKIKKRIEANRIVGTIGFRDHFSSHPGRHSWDLCGHPMYWWVLKTAAEAKYIEKILLWTEVEQAWEDARKMSDKFVIWKRSVQECIEPSWDFIDDLKTPESRIALQKHWIWRDEEIKKLLGFEPTVFVSFVANEPLVRAESVTRLIERYFEDDIAEQAVIISKDPNPQSRMKHPDHPEYLLPALCFSLPRQEYPNFYKLCGCTISSCYKGFNMAQRVTYIEVGRDEESDIHDEEDLEIARCKMRKRLEKEKNE